MCVCRYSSFCHTFGLAYHFVVLAAWLLGRLRLRVCPVRVRVPLFLLRFDANSSLNNIKKFQKQENNKIRCMFIYIIDLVASEVELFNRQISNRYIKLNMKKQREK